VTTAATQCQPELTGQIVVMIGGSAGIGPETAGRACAEGAGIILTGAAELGALSHAASGAGTAADRLEWFPGDLPEQMDRVMVAAVGPAVR
jgi:NAD(P)-dependent dehydrogenase (short-subunit alcohol dehydrogenase family)